MNVYQASSNNFYALVAANNEAEADQLMAAYLIEREPDLEGYDYEAFCDEREDVGIYPEHFSLIKGLTYDGEPQVIRYF